MISEDIILEAQKHAEAEWPRESCGLVIVYKGLLRYIACLNEAGHNDHFILSPRDYAKAEDLGEIMYIVHSHPVSSPDPSITDLVSIEVTQIPWIIVSPKTGLYTVTEPSGYTLPLLGREFHHGVVDCFTLVKDYYQRELGIVLNDYVRPDQWWETESNLYDDNYEYEGFVDVTGQPLQVHDALLMRIASKKNNHAAVYVGNNRIIHHPMNRLSTEDIYGGWWQKITSKVLRHKSLM